MQKPQSDCPQLVPNFSGDENGANLRVAGYTVNNLIQYPSRDVPAAVDVMGIALATSTVSVNGEAAYRMGVRTKVLH